MKINKLKKEDFEIFIKIIIEKFKEEKAKIPPKSEIKKEFNRILSSPDDIFIFIGSDSNIIGYLHGKIRKNYWNSGGNIEYLFVSKDFRKKGLATRLIKEFISLMKRRNFTKVTLNVNTKNKNAEKLYKKLGFEITSYVMRKKLK